MIAIAAGTPENNAAGTPENKENPVRIRRVSVDQTGQWLVAGWHDFKKAPKVSLTYGGAFVAMSWLLAVGLEAAGLGSLVLPLVGGFMLVAPILVVGLYDVSRRLETGEPVTAAMVCRACARNISQIAGMGVVLTLVFLVWMLTAMLLFASFFDQGPPPMGNFVENVVFAPQGPAFLIAGSVVGAVFAAIVFSVTAVSIPLLRDRDVDVFTAISVSLTTVKRNRRPMFGWALAIGLVVLMGLATFFVGLAVALPWLAYATWHAYRDLIAPAE